MDDALNRLSEAAGIEPRFWDIHGGRHDAPEETRRALLAGFGFDADTAEAGLAWFEAQACRPLPVSHVLYEHGRSDVPVRLSPNGSARRLRWSVRLETGESLSGEAGVANLASETIRSCTGRPILQCWLSLPKLPWGYHELTLEGAGAPSSCRLILSPGVGFLPPGMAQGRLTGVSTQLYALRSRGNWGIGDFGDLKRLCPLLAAAGADAVGLNPLHALFCDTADDASPYSPSSRVFRNPLYLDVTAVPEFAASAEAQAFMASDPGALALKSARAGAFVAYDAVAGLKRRVLECLYRQLCAAPDGVRFRAYRAYVASQGEALTRFAAFQAMSEAFGTHDWTRWPDGCHDPASAEAQAFIAGHADRIGYFAYVQWLCDVQLAQAAETAAEAGMAIGLYNDMAVSVNRISADYWCHQDLFAGDVCIGAPPDPFNDAGQEWGVVPMRPQRLAETGYAHFAALLAANMRHSGALRIDHVMGWLRLFLIPAGQSPAAGAYVRYPADELFAVATLESCRNRCLLIGEDLGTVPDGYRERMAATRMLSCKVFYFERENGGFRHPETYPPLSAASVSTHDLPTLRGFFEAADLDAKVAAGLFASAQEETAARDGRRADKRALMRDLRQAGLLPDGIDPENAETAWSEALATAVQRYLAQAGSKLVLVQMDDLAGALHQTNLPGTTRQYPNWCRRHPVSLERLPAHLGALRAASVARS